MIATSRGVAAHALAILADDAGPDSRRRAETYVAAIAQPDLEAVFLALPVLDGIVRHEIHTRAKDPVRPVECGAVHWSSRGAACDQHQGHPGMHEADVRTPQGDLGRVAWTAALDDATRGKVAAEADRLLNLLDGGES